MIHSIQDGFKSNLTSSISPSFAHSESFVGKGFVEVRPFYLIDGEKIYRTDEFSKHNLIVEKGRECLLDILTGVRTMQLKYIRWGKGGALSFPEGDPLQPLDVEDADTDVKSVLIDKILNPPTRVNATEVAYNETLISDEVNSDVNEAAMMFEEISTSSRIIFARITFPTIRLTVDQGAGIELKWAFSFNSAASSPSST